MLVTFAPRVPVAFSQTPSMDLMESEEKGVGKRKRVRAEE